MCLSEFLGFMTLVVVILQDLVLVLTKAGTVILFGVVGLKTA